MPELALSVLDQSPVPAGGTGADGVRATVELARAADRLGYHRYWLAEHHNSPALAGTAPEVLIARVAAETRGVRVGSGGVMLSHYSPLKVAESFRVLEALYPGRIDLGIGRAPGSDGRTSIALDGHPPGEAAARFPGQLVDLLGYLGGQLPPDHPYHGVRAMPEGSGQPELWLLGSSDQSAAYAAHLGLAFSFAHFINPNGGPDVMAAYRSHFRPTEQMTGPVGSVGISVVCAETSAHAADLAACYDLYRLRNETGKRGTFPTVEEARSHPYTDRDRAHIAANRGRMVVGDPPRCRAELVALAEQYGVSEMVIVTICPTLSERLRSYELLAETFGLAPR